MALMVHMKKLVVTSASGILLLLITLTLLKAKRWLEIDACLDSGGSWNYQTNRCEYDAPPTTKQDK